MEHNHPHDHSHGHAHGGSDGHHHGSPVAARANWRNSNLPFAQKLKLAGRNTWIKIRRRQACCGHPGEPGC